MPHLRRALHTSLFRYALCAGLILGQPALAQPMPAGCSMNEQWSLPLTYTEDLRPVAQATVNGKPVSVMLTTGDAKSIIFNRKVLAQLGVPMRQSTGFMSTEDERNPYGVDIIEDVTLGKIDTFSFGTYQNKNAEYFVEDFMDDTFGVRIGANTLLKTDIEIALDAGHLKAFSPSGCIREHLAYWDPKAIPVPTMSDPFNRDRRFVFMVRINGTNVRAILSTGTPQTYMPLPTAARLGLTPSSPGATREAPLPGHGADKPVWRVPVPKLSVGALDVKDLDVRLVDLPHAGDFLILGSDFLHRYRVYVAKSQNLVYFSPIATSRTLKRGSVNVIPQAIPQTVR